MPNTITNQTLVDGERNLVVKSHIVGDASGDETATQLLDISSFNGSPSEVKITSITSNLDGFSVHLHWDANDDVDIIALASGDSFHDFEPFGGLINNAGAGKSGDINISTSDLGSEEGTLIIEMKKRS